VHDGGVAKPDDVDLSPAHEHLVVPDALVEVFIRGDEDLAGLTRRPGRAHGQGEQLALAQDDEVLADVLDDPALVDAGLLVVRDRRVLGFGLCAAGVDGLCGARSGDGGDLDVQVAQIAPQGVERPIPLC